MMCKGVYAQTTSASFSEGEKAFLHGEPFDGKKDFYWKAGWNFAEFYWGEL